MDILNLPNLRLLDTEDTPDAINIAAESINSPDACHAY